jgi:hypothetical protein
MNLPFAFSRKAVMPLPVIPESIIGIIIIMFFDRKLSELCRWVFLIIFGWK